MEVLKHTGVVKEVNRASLIVSIINHSACSSCHAKGACQVSDSQQKEIEITSFRNRYQPGNMVTVVFKESAGFKALFLGYVLPFMVLITTLLIATEISGSEITGAFIALGMLAPYYIILYLSKDKLRKTFTFEIEET